MILVGAQAFEGFASSGVIVGGDEVGQVLLQLLVTVLVVLPCSIWPIISLLCG